MRTDVKLGVVISAIVVFLAGGYYMMAQKDLDPIPLTGNAAESTASVPNGAINGAKPAPMRDALSSKNSDRDPHSVRGPSSQPRDRRPDATTPHRTDKPGPTSRRTDASRRNDPSTITRAAIPAEGPGNSSQAATPTGERTSRRQAGLPPRTTTSNPNSGPTGVVAASDPHTGEPRDGAGRPSGNGAAHPSLAGKPDGASGTRSLPSPSVSGGAPLMGTGQPVGEETLNPAAPSVRGRAGSVPPTPRTAHSATKSADPRLATGGSLAGVVDSSGLASIPPKFRKTAAEHHRVQPGDTLSSIASAYYGSDRYVNQIIRANPQLNNPHMLAIGTVITIPPIGEEGATARTTMSAPSGATRAYTVQPGDTLYDIAARQLASPARWKELFELNKDLIRGNPRNLQIGQVLRLPDR